MQNSLILVALLVIVLWIVILLTFLSTSRKQVAIEDAIADVERKLTDRVTK